MERSVAVGRAMAEVAALARIREVTMTTSLSDAKAAERAMWALGDYHRFATQTVWEVGPVLVDACGVSRGLHVLDVAAGTGNVAIRAAEAGADVVASDLTPENFAAGRREADARGVALEWVEADAEALPFEHGAFDVVTSSFGAMFAPDHQAVADELVRVCRPGGTIGMANFTPAGAAARFFEIVGSFAPPPPPGALPPLLWGNEEHVRELFGDHVSSLELTHNEYVERSPGGARRSTATSSRRRSDRSWRSTDSSSRIAQQPWTASSSTSRLARTEAPRKRPNTTTSTSWSSPNEPARRRAVHDGVGAEGRFTRP